MKDHAISMSGWLQAEDDSEGILCVSTLHWLSGTAVLVGASVMEPSDPVQAETASRQVPQITPNHEAHCTLCPDLTIKRTAL